MGDKTAIGDRMKGYEKCWDFSLPRRMPIIIRVDGNKFSKLTRKLDKPFDQGFIDAMYWATHDTFKELPSCVFAWVASDEASFVLHGYKQLKSEPWFGNRLAKLTSLSAAIMTKWFNFSTRNSKKLWWIHEAVFDSRVFVLPEHEVCNYFIWRQRDWERNSVHMLARSLFSHKQLMNKNVTQMKEMIHNHESDAKWSELPQYQKEGIAVYRQQFSVTNENQHGDEVTTIRNRPFIDLETPIFSQNRDFIEQWFKTND